MAELAIPAGFRLAGVYTGVKRDPGKKDLTLIVPTRPATAAGVFTTNRVCAAPVQISRRRVPAEGIRAIVVNSGNANACTGEQGRADADQMTAAVAEKLGCSKENVLVCSTGIIGRTLPMDKIVPGIANAFTHLAEGPEAVDAASRGILTTDTTPKVASQRIKIGAGEVRVLGLAKGAAMIGPNMATMLSFLMTDAAVSPKLLDQILRQAVDKSFHCISVEGHTSTNDTVLILANGASGVSIDEGNQKEFAQAVTEVAESLARKIAEDAEEASHLITINVAGAPSDREARTIAKTVADSALVKTALYGNDPNWGRICSAVGYSGVPFKEEELSLTLNGTLLYDHGAPTGFDGGAESQKMKANREILVELTVGPGPGRCRFWTCDLTPGFVRFNAEYTT